MPGTDGLTVCRELRSVSDIPIILLTAKDSELDYVMGISQGSDDYLTKPFRPTILLMKVRALLRRVEMDLSLIHIWQVEVSLVHLVPQVGVLLTEAVILLLQRVDLVQHLGIGLFQCLLVKRHIVAGGQLPIQRLHLGVQFVQLLDVCQKRFLLRLRQGVGAADKCRPA